MSDLQKLSRDVSVLAASAAALSADRTGAMGSLRAARDQVSFIPEAGAALAELQAAAKAWGAIEDSARAASTAAVAYAAMLTGR